MTKLAPDYKSIYSDILDKKYPHKKEKCEVLLNKKKLSALDVIKLNQMIFGNTENENFTRRHNSYSKSDILIILDYQKKNRCNNSQLAAHFKLSRNTVTKWRKIFWLDGL